MTLLLLNYEYPPLGGGAGVCSKYHAEGLAKMGYHVVVITTWFKTEEEIEKKENLTIYRLKSIRKHIHKSNPIEMLSWVRETKIFLRKHIKSTSYKLCLANFAIPCGLVSIWAKKKYNIPYIIISHGQDIPWFFPKQLFFYHLINYKRIQNILKNSARNILLTKMMKKRADKMLPQGDRKKNVIIPNGTDIHFFSAKKNPPDEFRLLFSSRLVQQKRAFVFLKALKLLKQKGLCFKADIVGDGPLRRPMEQFVRKNKLGNDVIFHSWISKDDLLSFYHNAALMIITSAEEAMSLALLEALNCGLYTITTPVSGSKEMIIEKVNGDFINFEDYHELVEKMSGFKKDYFDKKYTVPKEAIEIIKKKYNWEKIVKEYANLIDQII